MLLERGEVVAVDDDAVWVQTLRRSTCGSCSARQGCGHSLLESVGAQRQHRVRVLAGRLTPAECRVGDTVVIAIPESLLLKASFLLYLLPVCVMLAGAAGGAWLWPQQELASLAGAALGLILGLAIVRWHGHRHAADASLQPTLESNCGLPDRAAQAVQTVELS